MAPHQVLVEFVSDQSGGGAGFNITATEHTTGCGGILHGMVSQESRSGQNLEIWHFMFGKILEKN